MKFKVNDFAIMNYTGGRSPELAGIFGWMVKIVDIIPARTLCKVIWWKDNRIESCWIHEVWLGECNNKIVTAGSREGSMLYEWQHEADEIKSLREKRDEQLRSLFN